MKLYKDRAAARLKKILLRREKQLNGKKFPERLSMTDVINILDARGYRKFFKASSKSSN